MLSRDYFLPHQYDFISSMSKEVALVAGFGSGKTYAFVYRTFVRLLTNKNKNGKANILIIYPTYNLAERVFVDKMSNILDKYNISYTYNKSKHIFYTSEGDIMIYQMQSSDKIVGYEATDVGIDEFDTPNMSICKDTYIKATGRLRGSINASFYIVTTPEGYKYTHKLFVEESNINRQLIKAKTTDNIYLPDGYIEHLKSIYDSRLLDQYLNGEFVNLNSGQVYYMFDRNTHICDTLIDNKLLHIGMDFNVNPMTAVISIIKNNIIYVIDEIVIKNANTEQMVSTIKSKYAGYNYIVYPDASGNQRRTSSGTTDIDILRNNNFQVIVKSTNPSVIDRVNTVNSYLLNSKNESKLVINPKCIKLIADLERVSYKENSREIDKTNPELTHVSDALGYLIYNSSNNINVPFTSNPRLYTSNNRLDIPISSIR